MAAQDNMQEAVGRCYTPAARRDPWDGRKVPDERNFTMIERKVSHDYNNAHTYNIIIIVIIIIIIVIIRLCSFLLTLLLLLFIVKILLTRCTRGDVFPSPPPPAPPPEES